MDIEHVYDEITAKIITLKNLLDKIDDKCFDVKSKNEYIETLYDVLQLFSSIIDYIENLAENEENVSYNEIMNIVSIIQNSVETALENVERESLYRVNKIDDVVNYIKRTVEEIDVKNIRNDLKKIDERILSNLKQFSSDNYKKLDVLSSKIDNNVFNSNIISLFMYGTVIAILLLISFKNTISVVLSSLFSVLVGFSVGYYLSRKV